MNKSTTKKLSLVVLCIALLICFGTSTILAKYVRNVSIYYSDSTLEINGRNVPETLTVLDGVTVQTVYRAGESVNIPDMTVTYTDGTTLDIDAEDITCDVSTVESSRTSITFSYEENGVTVTCELPIDVYIEITYNAGDGLFGTASTNVVSYYTACSSEGIAKGDIHSGIYTDPTRVGYTFAGWYTDKDCSTGKEFVLETCTASSAVYAKWTANTDTKYKINYYLEDLNAGTYTLAETETKQGTTDTEVTPEPKPYEGFTAPTAETVTILADGSRVVDYYYSRNTYYFDLNGVINNSQVGNLSGYGTCDIYINGTRVANDVGDYYEAHYYGSSYQITDIKTSAGRSYNGVSSGSLTGTIGAGAVEVFLNFSTVTYSVTINCNGGSGVSSTTYTVDSATFTLGTPTATGHTFTGWTGSNGSTPQKTVTIYQGTTGNLSYTANWSVNYYTQVNNFYTYDPYNGSWKWYTSKSASAKYGSWFTCTTDGIATPTGFYFGHFNTSGWTVTGDKNDGDGNGHFYPVQYTVSYDANGGTGAPAAHNFYMNGIGLSGTAYYSSTVPTRAGYTFTGWVCSQNGVAVSPGQAIPDHWGSPQTLVAQWEANGFRIGDAVMAYSGAKHWNACQGATHQYESNWVGTYWDTGTVYYITAMYRISTASMLSTSDVAYYSDTNDVGFILSSSPGGAGIAWARIENLYKVSTYAAGLNLPPEEEPVPTLISGTATTVASMPDISQLISEAEASTPENASLYGWIVDTGFTQQTVQVADIEVALTSIYEMEPEWEVVLTAMYLSNEETEETQIPTEADTPTEAEVIPTSEIFTYEVPNGDTVEIVVNTTGKYQVTNTVDGFTIAEHDLHFLSGCYLTENQVAELRVEAETLLNAAKSEGTEREELEVSENAYGTYFSFFSGDEDSKVWHYVLMLQDSPVGIHLTTDLSEDVLLEWASRISYNYHIAQEETEPTTEGTSECTAEEETTKATEAPSTEESTKSAETKETEVSTEIAATTEPETPPEGSEEEETVAVIQNYSFTETDGSQTAENSSETLAPTEPSQNADTESAEPTATTAQASAPTSIPNPAEATDPTETEEPTSVASTEVTASDSEPSTEVSETPSETTAPASDTTEGTQAA